MNGSGHHPAPTALPRVPTEYEAGWAPRMVWASRRTENSPVQHQSGIETRIVQPLNWSKPTIHLAKLTVIEGRAKAPVVINF